MLQVVIGGLIALVGTIVASSAVGEWLRRRDLRESIKGDLEIWDRLPDESDAKAGLLRRIDQRVASLGTQNPLRLPLLSAATYLVTSVVLITVMLSVTIINGGGRGFRRDEGGVLRFYGRTQSHTFQSLVLLLGLVVLFSVIYGFFAPTVITRLTKKIRRGRKRNPESSQTAQTD